MNELNIQKSNYQMNSYNNITEIDKNNKNSIYQEPNSVDNSVYKKSDQSKIFQNIKKDVNKENKRKASDNNFDFLKIKSNTENFNKSDSEKDMSEDNGYCLLAKDYKIKVENNIENQSHSQDTIQNSK